MLNALPLSCELPVIIRSIAQKFSRLSIDNDRLSVRSGTLNGDLHTVNFTA